MEPEPIDPARHWLTLHNWAEDGTTPLPRPIEEEVEEILASLRADPGTGDAYYTVHPAVRLSDSQVTAIELVLKEFAARTRRQVDNGELAPAGSRLAELAELLVSELQRTTAIADINGGG